MYNDCTVATIVYIGNVFIELLDAREWGGNSKCVALLGMHCQQMIVIDTSFLCFTLHTFQGCSCHSVQIVLPIKTAGARLPSPVALGQRHPITMQCGLLSDS